MKTKTDRAYRGVALSMSVGVSHIVTFRCRRPYTPDEEAFIMESLGSRWDSSTFLELASQLGRTIVAVRKRAWNLGSRPKDHKCAKCGALFGHQERAHKKRCGRCLLKAAARRHYLKKMGTEKFRAARAAEARAYRHRKGEDPEWLRKDRELNVARMRARRVARVAGLNEKQQGKCGICRKRLGSDIHVDHVIPRALGGSSAADNLQLTHPECNLSKGAALVPGGLGPARC